MADQHHHRVRPALQQPARGEEQVRLALFGDDVAHQSDHQAGVGESQPPARLRPALRGGRRRDLGAQGRGDHHELAPGDQVEGVVVVGGGFAGGDHQVVERPVQLDVPGVGVGDHRRTAEQPLDHPEGVGAAHMALHHLGAVGAQHRSDPAQLFRGALEGGLRTPDAGSDRRVRLQPLAVQQQHRVAPLRQADAERQAVAGGAVVHAAREHLHDPHLWPLAHASAFSNASPSIWPGDSRGRAKGSVEGRTTPAAVAQAEAKPAAFTAATLAAL